VAGEGTDKASFLSRLPLHDRAQRAHHEARHALLHQRALRGGEGVQHVVARAHEGAHVARLRLAAQRGARLGRREAGVHRHRRRSSVNRIQSRVFFGRSRQGLSTSWPSVTRMSRRFCPCQAGGHAAMARSRMLSESSGTIDCSVTS
jgi:hypothetical protein